VERKKIIRRSKISLLTILVSGLVIYILGYFFGRPILESKLKDAFKKASAGKYVLEFADLNISYPNRGIYLSQLSIKPNPDSILSMKDADLLEMDCKEASIYGIHFFETFFSKGFSAGELKLNEPQVRLWRSGTPVQKKKDTPRKDFGNLKLDKIRISNAKTIIKDRETDRFLFRTEQFNLFVEGFSLTKNLIPVYDHFTLETENNAITLLGGNEFIIGKLFIAGGPDYTALSAEKFDISEIEKPLRATLKIPDEIKFSLESISLEAESMRELVELIGSGHTEKIKISKLLIKAPNITLYTKIPGAGDSIEVEKEASIFEKLALPSIEKIGIVDGIFTYKTKRAKRPIFKAEGISFSATALRPFFRNHIPLICSNLSVSAKETQYTQPGSDYTFNVNHWNYRAATDSLLIYGLRMNPHQSVDSFHRYQKWRIDRFEFKSDTVEIQHLNLPKYASLEKFGPDTIVFKNPEFQAFNDKRLNHDPNFKKPFPLGMLRGLGGYFEIGGIHFKNGKLTYSELVANSPGKGNISMQNVDFKAVNIKHPALPGDSLHLLFSGSFGKESHAEIKVDIPLFGEDEIQHARGKIKNLNFKTLNSITENTVFLGFADGVLDSSEFWFTAKNGVSEGYSFFYYRDLKVKIYKVKEVKAYNNAKLLFNRTFLSLAANFLINKNNPDPEGYSYPGRMEFERDPLKGPLNFWIKTIMTGLMNTVVDDISELKELQEEIKGLKTQSTTGLLSKMKSDPAKRNARRMIREAKKTTKNGDEN